MPFTVVARRKGSRTLVPLEIVVEIRKPDNWRFAPRWFPYSPRWGLPPIRDPAVQAFLDAVTDFLVEAAKSDTEKSTGTDQDMKAA